MKFILFFSLFFVSIGSFSQTNTNVYFYDTIVNPAQNTTTITKLDINKNTILSKTTQHYDVNQKLVEERNEYYDQLDTTYSYEMYDKDETLEYSESMYINGDRDTIKSINYFEVEYDPADSLVIHKVFNEKKELIMVYEKIINFNQFYYSTAKNANNEPLYYSLIDTITNTSFNLNSEKKIYFMMQSLYFSELNDSLESQISFMYYENGKLFGATVSANQIIYNSAKKRYEEVQYVYYLELTITKKGVLKFMRHYSPLGGILFYKKSDLVNHPFYPVLSYAASFNPADAGL